MNYVIRVVIIVASFCFFILGLIFSSPYVLLSSIILILLQNIYYSLERFNERVIFFTFNIVMTIFLLGRIIVKAFFNYKASDANLFSLNFTDVAIVNHILMCLYLSFLFLYLGFNFIQRFKVGKLLISDENNLSTYWNYVKTVSKYFFFITILFRILYIKDISTFVNQNSYYDYYVSFASNLPSIFLIINSFYEIAFFTFLAMKPSKKDAIVPIILFLMVSVYSLSTGQRSSFVLSIVIIFIYFCYRNLDYKKVKKWFGKKEVITSLILLPLILVIMPKIGELRGREPESSDTFFGSILDFFYTQGVSANVIGYSKFYEHMIPENRLYTLGPLTRIIKESIISKFVDIPIYTGQTIEKALYGDSFAHTISYIVMPEVYVTGSGYGSSYIAELYVDFGYIGIILGSFCLGIIIFIIYKGLFSNPLIRIFTLIMIWKLSFTPRSDVISFITGAFSKENIIGLLFILIGSFLLQATVNQKSTWVNFGKNNLK